VTRSLLFHAESTGSTKSMFSRSTCIYSTRGRGFQSTGTMHTRIDTPEC
jgi:hypothetical protein